MLLKASRTAASWPGTKALIRPEYVEIGKPGEFKLSSATEGRQSEAFHFRGSEWIVEVEVGEIEADHVSFAGEGSASSWR